MKKLLSILMTVLLVLALAVPALAEEAEAPAPQIVDAKVITYVTDEARTTAAVRIEYDQPITTGTYGLSDYFVNGYDVRAVYVSDTGVYQEAARTGNYVIVEFAISQVPGYSEGKMNFWTTDNSYIDPTLDVYCPGDDCWFTTTGCIHFEADDYTYGSVTSEDGTETLYRLYIPEGYEAADESLEDLPLVIWLHGSGESGTDNEEQLLANRGALNFSSKEAQAAHPCFVLAPQTNVGWNDVALTNIKTIVDGMLTEYNVDGSRIYVIGCSMGGMGTRQMIQMYPEMVAAGIPLANNAYDDVITRERFEEDFAGYEGIPMLYIVSADDPSMYSKDESLTDEERSVEAQVANAVEAFQAAGMTTYASIGDDALNGYLRGELAANEMQEVLDAAAEAGADKIFVTYLAGTVQPAAHSSWMPATANTAVRDWIFAQVNDAPYTAE